MRAQPPFPPFVFLPRRHPLAHHHSVGPTEMTDPLSISVGVAGLVTLAQGLIVPLCQFIGKAKSAAAEVNTVVEDIKTFCGVLCIVKPVIEQVEKRNPKALQSGSN